MPWAARAPQTDLSRCKLQACQGLVKGMSYWTSSDLFEEHGPPTASFEGGFGLMNREGIRKSAFFAYKYLHALEGERIDTNDSQTLAARSKGDISAVLWDFEQPKQQVSNRSFYTKVVPAHPAAAV